VDVLPGAELNCVREVTADWYAYTTKNNKQSFKAITQLFQETRSLFYNVLEKLSSAVVT